MVYLTETEIAPALEALCVEISTGLREARDRGVVVRMTETVDIEFTLLVTANAFESTITDTEPSLTTTSTAVYPDVEEVTIDSGTKSETRTEDSQRSDSNSENYTPPGQVTISESAGDTRQTEDRTYSTS